MVIHFESKEAAVKKLIADRWYESKTKDRWYNNTHTFVADIAWIPNSKAVAVYYGER